MNKQLLQTLLPDKYIDDNIVNVFCEILTQKYPENALLIFDAQFLYSLLQYQDGHVGFMKWAQNMKA